MKVKKKRKPNSGHVCIIHFKDVHDKKITRATQQSFDKITNVCSLRKDQPAGSKLRLAEVCNRIPAAYQQHH